VSQSRGRAVVDAGSIAAVIEPSFLKAGLSFARVSMEVSARGPSSYSRPRRLCGRHSDRNQLSIEGAEAMAPGPCGGFLCSSVLLFAADGIFVGHRSRSAHVLIVMAHQRPSRIMLSRAWAWPCARLRAVWASGRARWTWTPCRRQDDLVVPSRTLLAQAGWPSAQIRRPC